MTAPTRRGLLTGIAVLAPVASALPLAMLPAASDAVLLGLCVDYHRLYTEAEALPDDTKADDAAFSATNARRWGVSQQIETIPARTPAGKAAKAGVALHALVELGEPAFVGTMERLVLVALAEAAGLSVPAAPEDKDDGQAWKPAVFPDAELLEACANADEVQRRIDALWTGPTRVDDDNQRDTLLDPLRDEQHPFLEQVVDLRAQTLAGHMARARTLLLWDKDPPSADDSYYMNERLMGALLRDLDGEALT